MNYEIEDNRPPPRGNKLASERDELWNAIKRIKDDNKKSIKLLTEDKDTTNRIIIGMVGRCNKEFKGEYKLRSRLGPDFKSVNLWIEKSNG